MKWINPYSITSLLPACSSCHLFTNPFILSARALKRSFGRWFLLVNGFVTERVQFLFAKNRTTLARQWITKRKQMARELTNVITISFEKWTDSRAFALLLPWQNNRPALGAGRGETEGNRGVIDRKDIATPISPPGGIYHFKGARNWNWQTAALVWSQGTTL